MKQKSYKNTKSSKEKTNAIPFTDARTVASYIVQKIVHGESGIQATLDMALQRSKLSVKDRNLCTELAYGSLRKLIRLEWFLRRYLNRFDKLPQEMQIMLVIACYEVFYTRIPIYATVDAYVTHVKKIFGLALSRVANGVLRSIDRERDSFFDQTLYDTFFPDTISRLACLHSMPEWLVEIWFDTYGEETTLQYLDAFEKAAPFGLRLNRQKDFSTVRAELLPYVQTTALEHVFHFDTPVADEAQTTLYRAIQEGFASQQSAAALMLLEEFEPETWAGPVWDCCSGQGGKTFALLERGVEVKLASDISQARLQNLKEEMHRLGLGSETVVKKISADGKDSQALEHALADVAKSFGTIVIDAPCSGFGTLARHPEIRIRRTKDDVKALVQLQRAILQTVASKVHVGGRIVYITCTVHPEENEKQLQWFCQNFPQFDLEKEVTTPADSPLREFFYGCSFVRRE